MLLGVSDDWVCNNLLVETKVAFLYCRTVEDLISVEKLIKAIRKKRPDVKVCLFENIQTVNSFSLKEIAPSLLKQGAHLAVLGEPELSNYINQMQKLHFSQGFCV